MSYFAPYIDTSGLHLPTYADVLEYLINEYRSIFGSEVYLGEDSQDYQMIALFAKAWSDLTAVVTDAYNARNPDWATGASLDHQLAMAGISRYPATASTVTLAMTGVASQALTAGQLVMDNAGYIWQTDEAVTFDENGEATVTATCTQTGPVNASADTITIIQTPSSFWYTVTNPAAAVPGHAVESDSEANQRRKNSVNLPGRSTVESVQAALINVSGVTHVSVLENNTGSTDDRGIPAHSICAVVGGGDQDDIAAQIFLKKAPGIGTYGSTSVSYTDLYGNTNTINFTRPAEEEVDVTISLNALSGFDTTSGVDTIIAAVQAYINTLDIGEDLVVPMLYSICYMAFKDSSPAFAITGITATPSGGSSSATKLTATYDQRFVAGTVTVNVS